MQLSDVAARKKREVENRKLYYMLNNIDSRRNRLIDLETDMMKKVQKTKFGSTNYQD